MFSATLVITLLIFLIINLIQLPIERQSLENNLSFEEENLSASMEYYREELESGNDEYEELYAQASQTMSYLRQSRRGLVENNDEVYLSSYIAYIDNNHVFNGLLQDTENLEDVQLSDFDRNTREHYQALLLKNDPYEAREVSLRYPYFPVYTIEFLFSPPVFVILILISQFILMNEYDLGAYRFALVETKKRSSSLMYKQLSTLVLFSFGFISIFLLSGLVARLMNRPFIGQEFASWESMLFTYGEHFESISLREYAIVLTGSCIVLFILFSVVLHYIISYVHSSVISGLLFLLFVLSGSYLTYYQGLDFFFNPFNLFFLEERVFASGLVYYMGSIMSSLSLSGILMYLISNKLESDPL